MNSYKKKLHTRKRERERELMVFKLDWTHIEKNNNHKII